MIHQTILTIKTPGRGLINITDQITQILSAMKIEVGLCNIFLHHTSASLTFCENDDPSVISDLEKFMQRLSPDGDPLFHHVAEGPDDMPAHVRTILTQSSLTLPITDHQLVLGRWQGIFLWEHRLRSYLRKMTVTLQG